MRFIFIALIYHHYTTFAASEARIKPTFQAVHLIESFTGLGIEPFFTPLQQEADEMPYRRLRTGRRI